MLVSLEHRTLQFSRPAKAAYESISERQLVLLSLSEDGLTGRGEAAPLEPYDGVSVRKVTEALTAYQGVLEPSAGEPRAQRLAACRAAADLPQALAAVDVALWELEALRAGRPLAALLADFAAGVGDWTGPSGSPLAAVPVSELVDADEPAVAADQAADAARRGFPCLKLKVGTRRDGERVRAVRAAAGPGVALRLDANGAWSVGEAARALAALAPAQPELVEEPVHGLDALRQLKARTDLPLAIDETAADTAAVAAGVADAVCLKLARCGGVSGLLDAAAAARAAGSRVYLGSTYDGPVGIAASLHAAAVLRPDHACGLATLELFGDPGPLPVLRGAIAVPAQPGLGV